MVVISIIKQQNTIIQYQSLPQKFKKHQAVRQGTYKSHVNFKTNFINNFSFRKQSSIFR